MVELGVVARIEGDVATVSFARRGECDRCRMCRVAGDGSKCVIDVKNSLEVSVGDYVKVEVFNGRIHTLSALIYALPLLLTAICVGLGTLMGLIETVILGVAGFAVGMGIAIPVDLCVIRKAKGFKPVMTEIISEAEYLKSKVDTYQICG